MSPADIPFERLLSMPAFEGLRVLRVHKKAQPNLPWPELMGLVAKVEADAYALDLEAASRLLTSIDPNLPDDGVPFYRGCLSAVLLEHQPVWLRILTQEDRDFCRNSVEMNTAFFVRPTCLRTNPMRLFS